MEVTTRKRKVECGAIAKLKGDTTMTGQFQSASLRKHITDVQE